MKANRVTFQLLMALFLSTAFGCATYEEGSLLQMQHEHEQRLYLACVRAQLDRNLQYITDMSSISSACRTWAHQRIKPNLPNGGRRVGAYND